MTMSPPQLDIFRRFYWRAVWLLAAHNLRVWLLADATVTKTRRLP